MILQGGKEQITMKLVILAAGVILSTAAGAQTAPKAAGHWQGKILIPDHELGASLDLAQNAKGAWIGSISIPGSTSVDVPISGITVTDTAVKFSANLPQPSTFEGRLSADGASLAGTASSAAGEAPFQLARSGEANVKLPPPSSMISKEFAGIWEGSIDAGGKARRIGLKVTGAADGTAAASLLAIDQGNLEIPISTVTISGKELTLEARAISGTYRGTLTNNEIAGEWTQGPSKVPLTFHRVMPDAK
jgi:hypothetical protein